MKWVLWLAVGYFNFISMLPLPLWFVTWNRTEYFFLAPVFLSVICCIQGLKKKKSQQQQSLSRCCSLWDKSTVRSGSRSHGANNHNKLEITWEISITCALQVQRPAPSGFGLNIFAATVLGSVLSGGPVRVPTCACVPASRVTGTRCYREKAFQ